MKNFKQFTTCWLNMSRRKEVFMMVQRWRISSNSQPKTKDNAKSNRCLWWFKDEEFQAIHNCKKTMNTTVAGVYDGSKMKNFKQFTTTDNGGRTDQLVFMMVQRWRISSNSQPLLLTSFSNPRCLWWFKDEEFQAIHNSGDKFLDTLQGVYDGSKMKNFKQFTTDRAREVERC